MMSVTTFLAVHVIIVTKKAYLKLNFYDRFVSECCLWSETME